MTRKDFARILDVTVSTISLIEKGDRSIPSYSVHKLSKALDVPFEDFYYGTETLAHGSASEEILIEQINAIIRTFRQDQLEYAVDIMRGIVELSK